MKSINIKQDEIKPIPTEVLAENILAIAQGVRRLRAGPLNDRALFLLIQHAAPTSLSLSNIKSVFEGIDLLEKTYIKKRAK